MEEDLGDFIVSEKIREKLKNEKWLKKELQKGKTPQEIMGFSFESMEKFHQAARRLFEGKRYVDAAHAFLFLVTLNSYHHDYWLGLGMSLQLCHEYESAIDAYEMAAVCKLENPIPFFYLAKCLFAIHDRTSALEALNLAIEYADDWDEYKELKAQAMAAKAILLKEE